MTSVSQVENMYKVLVTGSIGSGKSSVCREFEELGVPVYYSDDRAKHISDNNKKVVHKIMLAFGEDIYDGFKLKRKELAKIVFSDPEQLKILSSIVHPAVAKDFDKWCKKQDSPYVIEESAIDIECGLKNKFDHIIVVTADEDVRIERVISRDSCTEEDVRLRMDRQMPDEEKVGHADTVIVNHDLEKTKKSIQEIHEKLLQETKK